MMQPIRAAILAAALLALTASGASQDAGASTREQPPPGYHWATEAQVLEPKAVDLLKAASARLASARTLSFTAIIADEAPSRLGPPLLYASCADVSLKRPDRFRIISSGTGPRSELYLKGTERSAWAPAEGFIAGRRFHPPSTARLRPRTDLPTCTSPSRTSWWTIRTGPSPRT